MIFRISSISYVKRQVRDHLISEQKYTFIIADSRNHVGYQYGDNPGHSLIQHLPGSIQIKQKLTAKI